MRLGKWFAVSGPEAQAAAIPNRVSAFPAGVLFRGMLFMGDATMLPATIEAVVMFPGIDRPSAAVCIISAKSSHCADPQARFCQRSHVLLIRQKA
jgi:hypothetical protein